MKNKLPEGWREVKIGEIAKVNSGQGAPQGDKWYKGTEVFIKAGDLNNLTDGKYVGDFCQKITKEAIGRYQLKKYTSNSIVFPKSGMSVKTDNIAILKYDSYVVNHLAIIQPKDVIDSKIIFYLLKRLKISNLSKNPSYPSIRLPDINNFELIWPSLDSRKKIVSILEKAESAKNMRKEADGLTKDYLNSVFLKMFGDPGKNEKKFNTVPIREMVLKTENETPQKDYPHEYFKYIDISSIDAKQGKIVSTANLLGKDAPSRARQKVKSYDLLISTVRPNLNAVALVPENLDNQICSTGFCILRSDIKQILPEYIYFITRNNYFIESLVKKCKGANYPAVSNNDIKSVKIPIPPLPLQTKFSKIVEQVEKLKEYQKQSKTQIDDLFNALMQKAFKGELII